MRVTWRPSNASCFNEILVNSKHTENYFRLEKQGIDQKQTMDSATVEKQSGKAGQLRNVLDKNGKEIMSDLLNYGQNQGEKSLTSNDLAKRQTELSWEPESLNWRLLSTHHLNMVFWSLSKKYAR